MGKQRPQYYNDGDSGALQSYLRQIAAVELLPPDELQKLSNDFEAAAAAVESGDFQSGLIRVFVDEIAEGIEAGRI